MGETKTTPAKVLQPALASHYSPPAPGPAVVEGDELLSMLETLPSLSVDEHIDTMQGRSANIIRASASGAPITSSSPSSMTASGEPSKRLTSTTESSLSSVTWRPTSPPFPCGRD